MALKDWRKVQNNFGDGWTKKVGLNKKQCSHSERFGDYCEHCETGTKDIEIYVLNDEYFNSPNYGLWYVKITKLPKKWFKTKSQALAYAKQYMRSH